MRYRVGDRVVYVSDGPDGGLKGTVVRIMGERFEVKWSDGEVIDYTDRPGCSVYIERVGADIQSTERYDAQFPTTKTYR